VNGFLAYLIGIVVFLVGIGISIGLHEIGHLWPAKRFGARVTKYMIGFGPTLWSKRTEETEYGIKLLPLGGFIAISGMFPPRPTGQERKPDGWLRSWVEQARKQQLDQDGNYDETKAFYRLSIPKRIVIMLGGPTMNLILGSVLILAALSGIGGYQNGNKVTTVLPCVFTSYTQTACLSGDVKSPAGVAGLKSGDVITALNGKPVTMWAPVQEQLLAHPSAPIRLTVLRGSKSVDVVVKPAVKPRPIYDDVSGVAKTDSAGNVVLAPRGLLGIQLNSVRAPFGVDHSVAYMGYTLGSTFKMIGQLPQQVGQLAVTTFTGGKRSANGPVSVVGIGMISGQIVDNNSIDLAGKTATLLMILGSLNYALFAFNLIPLLPLDGGHVLSAAVEGVRNFGYKLRNKKIPGPMDTARLVPLTMVMWVLLMGLSVLVIIADVVNPVALG